MISFTSAYRTYHTKGLGRAEIIEVIFRVVGSPECQTEADSALMIALDQEFGKSTSNTSLWNFLTIVPLGTKSVTFNAYEL